MTCSHNTNNPNPYDDEFSEGTPLPTDPRSPEYPFISAGLYPYNAWSFTRADIPTDRGQLLPTSDSALQQMMPGDATNPYIIQPPAGEPEVVTMDGLTVGLDPDYQIIVLKMESADPNVRVIPVLQLNLLGAVQLMQMLRAHVRTIEKLPPLSTSHDTI